jgi:single-strand DNA-binding protein
MNRVELIGRLTADPSVKTMQNENNTCIATFTLAVNRRFKKDEADFIRCIAFGKTGELVEKYMKKGLLLGVCGRIQTGSYTNRDGQKIYTTDVIVEEITFCQSKKEAEAERTQGTKNTDNDGFMNIPDNIDEELPFN